MLWLIWLNREQEEGRLTNVAKTAKLDSLFGTEAETVSECQNLEWESRLWGLTSLELFYKRQDTRAWLWRMRKNLTSGRCHVTLCSRSPRQLGEKEDKIRQRIEAEKKAWEHNISVWELTGHFLSSRLPNTCNYGQCACIRVQKRSGWTYRQVETDNLDTFIRLWSLSAQNSRLREECRLCSPGFAWLRASRH